eukprot:14196963-Alexandrium_andersonii.AAC.1
MAARQRHLARTPPGPPLWMPAARANKPQTPQPLQPPAAGPEPWRSLATHQAPQTHLNTTHASATHRLPADRGQVG